MSKLVKVLGLLAALTVGSSVAHAADCCKPGAKCCKPDAPCCKK